MTLLSPHLMDASSAWVQSFSPQSLCSQSQRLSSSPQQSTLSRPMLPFPSPKFGHRNSPPVYPSIRHATRAPTSPNRSSHTVAQPWRSWYISSLPVYWFGPPIKRTLIKKAISLARYNFVVHRQMWKHSHLIMITWIIPITGHPL